MRELTTHEMKELMKAAESALPEDCKGTGLVLLVATDVEGKGLWVNRISNVSKLIADHVLELWGKALQHRKDYGTPNRN